MPRPSPISALPGWLAMAALVIALAGCGGALGAAEPTPAATPGTTTPTPAPTDAGVQPGTSPGATTAVPTQPLTPGPTVPRVPALEPPAYASRVTVDALGVDLPVISADFQPPPSYPLCDVAAYVTRFGQPYDPGITYISAHAQRGMFLPLLEASERQDGQELLGMEAAVYTSDGRRFDYRIEEVVRHATDYTALTDLPLDERHLVLQTSEGPYGTVEKLQVIAEFVGQSAVDPAEAAPEANPRDCRPDELRH